MATAAEVAPRIAIAGNPNSGKTSIFNALTGLNQSVANYPGVTVEMKSGRVRRGDASFEVVDLPGTYSLVAFSRDEVVARDYVIEQRPDAVLNVVDASNLERNLYLTVQLMEMRVPLVISLNMIDVAEKRGARVDVKKLSQLLGAPVVPTVGNRGQGLDEVIAACGQLTGRKERKSPSPVYYGHVIDEEVARIALLVGSDERLAHRYAPRWLAVKLLEGDKDIAARIRELAPEAAPTLERATNESCRAIQTHFSIDAGTLIAERRYGFVAGAIRECAVLPASVPRDATDRIDAVVTNRWLGPLVLGTVIYALFMVVFKVGEEWNWLFGRSPKGWTEALFEWFASLAAPMGERWPLLGSLVSDGLIGGVGGVVSFVPLIALLFFFVALLEDSGYIARVAFIMDRVLRAFGLQGKSVLAMIVSGGLGGGGCAGPGLMAARTLPEEKDRLVTMLVAPLMNCGAKLPVHLMLVAAFFAGQKALMLFVLWLASWIIAVGAALMLRKFVVRGEQTPFVMELPAYHMPTLRGALLHTWERTWQFLKKAGTILLAVNVVLWALMCFPRLSPERSADYERRAETAATDAERGEIQAERRSEELAGSVAGRLGRALVPVSRLAGFEWRENIALIGGLAAKEVVVGTLGTAYALGDVDPNSSEGLSERLRADPGWSRLKAFVMMLFVLVYSPCIATLAVMRRETGSWKWPAFATLYTTVMAFAIAVAVFQIGRLLGLGG